MKILFLAPVPYFSNQHPAPWVSTLIAQLDAKGIKITILNYSHHCKNNIEKFYKGNIEYIFIKTIHPKINLLTFYYDKIKKLTQFVNERKTEFDIIHIFGNEHQFEISLKNIDVPAVLHVQGIISEYKKVYKQKGLKRIMWYMADKFEKLGYNYIVNYSCRTKWDQMIVKNHRPDAKIFNIWEMIREEFFLYEKIDLGKNILFIGGTNLIKGLHFALKSFDKVKDITGGKFVIVGNSDKNIINKIIRENELLLDIDKDLVLKGFLEPVDILKCYDDCFCLLHPSLIDNSPNSVCEAQVAGLPVIASDVGGVSSVIEDEETGLLVKLETEDIKNSILKLYSDKNLWNKISLNSKKVSKIRHDPKLILTQTMNMYKSIIN